MAELPTDWRARVVDMVRGEAPLDGGWFGGGPVCSPVEQIAIYRQQYRLRMVDAVREEAPGLVALLGEAGDALFERYVDERPSRSFTLNHIADGLADWLAARGAPDAQVDMARLDHAVQSGFTAAEGQPLDAADLEAMPPLRLAPHVRLLRLRTAAHLVRALALAGQPFDEARASPTPLVVFRRGLKMRHWACEEPLWQLLAAIGRGRGVADALAAAVAVWEGTEDALPGAVAGWFRDLAERGLVEAGERS